MAAVIQQNEDRAAPLLQVPKPLSYAAVVEGCKNPTSPRSSAKSFNQVVSNGGKIGVKKPGTFRGESAVFFSKEEISELVNPFRFTLVGKFSYGRPPMVVIRKFFASLGLKSLQSVGLLQDKHVVIFLNQEEDYTRLILRSFWYISGSPMKMMKWSPDFITSFESPVVPVWVGFPGLPIHFFEKSALFNIASAFGTPLKMDEPTVMLTRPSVARVCIEVDVSKPKNQRMWIGTEKEGYWQEIVFENLPSYCNYCHMLGHKEKVCFTKNPELKKPTVAEKNGSVGIPKARERNQKCNEGEWQVVKRKNKEPATHGNTQKEALKDTNATTTTNTSQPTIPTSHPQQPAPNQSTIYITPPNQQKPATKLIHQDKPSGSSHGSQSDREMEDSPERPCCQSATVRTTPSSAQQFPAKSIPAMMDSAALAAPTRPPNSEGEMVLSQQKSAASDRGGKSSRRSQGREAPTGNNEGTTGQKRSG